MARKTRWSEAERRYAIRAGAQIAGVRAYKKITQAALADRLGISQGRIAAVELGKSDLSRDEIAAALGVDLICVPAPSTSRQRD